MSRLKLHKLNSRSSKGFSLVEVLIASVLGLLLLAGVVQLFVGSSSTFRMQQQLGGVQTDGRFALMFLERSIENAGWFTDNAPSFASAVDFTQSSDGGSSGNDSIMVQMDVEPGVTSDCNGVAVPGTVLQNRFYMNGTTLECLGNGGGTAQPVIENVESFQVLYGVDTDANGIVNQYMSATDVAGGGYDNRVIAVQVALLIVTQNDTLTENKSKDYNVLDVAVTKDDKKVRRVFRQTIMMPNQAFILVNNNKTS